MIQIDAFLSLFEKVKPAGQGKWMARCSGHPDKTPSLMIIQYPDGIGLRCFAGCDQTQVLDGVSLTYRDVKEGYDTSNPAEIRYARHASELRRKTQKEEENEQWAIDATQSALELFWELDLDQLIAAFILEEKEEPYGEPVPLFRDKRSAKRARVRGFLSLAARSEHEEEAEPEDAGRWGRQLVERLWDSAIQDEARRPK